ncbi:MAG TPA: SRPBCC family protein, partial [Solirubrobacteraceae bacterium]|nr:SRPBCC family protein [Solirubrobacteraceae bacterium]
AVFAPPPSRRLSAHHPDIQPAAPPPRADMPTVSRTRTIPAPLPSLWETVSDPHHLARWWPRVVRVESVAEDAFTEVLSSSRGRLLRADFNLLHRTEDTHAIAWQQVVENTPFARLLKSARTSLSLAPASASAPDHGDGTEVTIELDQSLNGFFSRFGSFMVRKAALQTLDEALDGLERIAGPA